MLLADMHMEGRTNGQKDRESDRKTGRNYDHTYLFQRMQNQSRRFTVNSVATCFDTKLCVKMSIIPRRVHSSA